MDEHDDERKSTTHLWLDGFRGFKEEDLITEAPPKNRVQFAAFSIVFKSELEAFKTVAVDALRQITNQIHRNLLTHGISQVRIIAGISPDVKLSGKQVVTVFQGYALENPEDNPVLPVKLFRPFTETMKKRCKQKGVASWKYAGLLDNSDLVRESLETQIQQPFAIVQGLDPTKSEYYWFDREYKVVGSEIVYKEFPKEVIGPV